MIGIDDKYKVTFNHFGLEAQIQKLDEEVEELKNAIEEWAMNGGCSIEDILLEAADVKNVAMGIAIGLGGDSMGQVSRATEKMDRTIKRIRLNYYG